MMIPVEVNAEVLELLVRLGWVANQDAGDKRAVGAAIARLLADAARR
jgi:hypothetical protein